MRMVTPIRAVPGCWPAAMSVSDKYLLLLLKRWNWKAAVLSAIIRAPVFLITTYSFGWHSATLAAGVETAYCAGTAGVFAGVIQTVRDWRPIWLASLLITVGVPVFSQALDYSAHLLAHTPNLRAGTLASFSLSEMSALFSWYSMRRGTLLVGAKQDSFLHDLFRLPRLLLGFVFAPLTWLLRYLRQARVVSDGDHDNDN